VDADSSRAQLALGRALYERGENGPALDAIQEAVGLDPSSYGAVLAYGQALAAANQGKPAEQALARAIALSPRAAEPHFELARLKLDGGRRCPSGAHRGKTFPQT